MKKIVLHSRFSVLGSPFSVLVGLLGSPFSVLACLSLLLMNPVAAAHPIPKSSHDRTIVVRLQPAEQASEIAVRVDYRLEVDPATVILEDMQPFQDEIDISKFKSRMDYFKEFTRIYEPILAERLIAQHNGTLVNFVCSARTETLRDEKGEALDHLRCDFVFGAILKCGASQENVFTFREANYQEQEGAINLALVPDSVLRIVSLIEPDAAVKSRPAQEQLPGDDAKLRRAEIRFTLSSAPAATTPIPAPVSTLEPHDEHSSGLLRLFLESEYGLAALLLIAAYIGAMHALTPGHGKTLMAAYLVGQRGTFWHAVILGLTTALTHTGVVLLLALGLLLLPSGMTEEGRRLVQAGLGLGMGLVIVCLGFYLLLLRLSGQADHIHIGGGHHHHHQHEQTHTPAALPEKIGTWSLILLGMSGGMVPCTDAIAMLVLAIGMNLFWLAFPLLVAFSAGLAGVLVAVGILVVKFRDFAGSKWGEGRFVRALPIVSALLVTAMGFWLCYEAVHGVG